MTRRNFMSIRVSEKEKRQIEEVAQLWGCKTTEVLRLTFRLVMLRGPQKFSAKAQSQSGKAE